MRGDGHPEAGAERHALFKLSYRAAAGLIKCRQIWTYVTMACGWLKLFVASTREPVRRRELPRPWERGNGRGARRARQRYPPLRGRFPTKRPKPLLFAYRTADAFSSVTCLLRLNKKPGGDVSLNFLRLSKSDQFNVRVSLKLAQLQNKTHPRRGRVKSICGQAK